MVQTIHIYIHIYTDRDIHIDRDIQTIHIYIHIYIDRDIHIDRDIQTIHIYIHIYIDRDVGDNSTAAMIEVRDMSLISIILET
jgi:hypothetical protein